VPGLDHTVSEVSMAAAAQCVHQMRVMLQVGQNPDHSNVYLISSSTAGEGKTSVATSLALSFAASGARTLLIDCDLVGQSLTRNLAAQSEQGLREALMAGTVRGHLKRTIAGLAVMTVGRATEEDAATVSLASMRRLLADARDHFDVIVLDSGPILGSVEATAAAQVADRVILTVARGQEQYLANRAVRQLRSLGASIAGVVFNRAKATDVHHSGYASSYRTTSSPQDLSGQGLARQQQAKASRFGPLVRAVIASLPPDLTRAPAGAGAN
jgi:capsular exopolysaccharide synthesis family protein